MSGCRTVPTYGVAPTHARPIKFGPLRIGVLQRSVGHLLPLSCQPRVKGVGHRSGLKLPNPVSLIGFEFVNLALNFIQP